MTPTAVFAYRDKLVGARSVLLVLVAVVAVALGGPALATASVIAGPVSPALIRALNSAGTEFRLAPHGAHPRISKRAAIRDAVRQAPWRNVTATGISLITVAIGVADAPVGSLAWLVSFEPVSAGGEPAPGGPAPTGAQTASYYVVAVTATNGQFIASAHGSTSSSPTP